MPLNLDADPENADWPKRTWDLPTDPDVFIATVAPTPEALAAFLRLPAARPMPAELRAELVRRGRCCRSSRPVPSPFEKRRP